MPPAATALRRSDIRQQFDRPTGATLLLYVGRSLRFEDELYGYPEGAFFAAALDEVPLPAALAVEADKCGVDISKVSAAADVRHAVLEVLVAEAMVNAPALLGELTLTRLAWPDWELRDLERRHQITVSRLVRVAKLAEQEITTRSTPVRYDPGPVQIPSMMPPPDVFFPTARAGQSEPVQDPEPFRELPTEPLPIVPPPEPEPEPDDDEPADDTDPGVPGAQVIERVSGAVRTARESELQQRLPGGVRRRLRHFQSGAYVAQGDSLDPRADLAHAMADAQSMSKRRGEAAVIDWDGEWPVVVRRYGANGCTVYKVEDALRRAGVDAAQ